MRIRVTFSEMANILDVNVIGTGSVLRTAAIFFYLSNEGVSLLENAAHLGLPVPGAIKEVLEQLHERAEHGGNDNDEQSKLNSLKTSVIIVGQKLKIPTE